MKPSTSSRLSAFFALNGLKRIIHPQLPLTARQSQQLLELLQTSFREQLAAAAIDHSKEDGNSINASGPPPSSLGDTHISDLLKAPPFFIISGASNATSGSGDRAGMERFIRSPLEVYHELSVQGAVTTGIAWATLKRHTTNMLSLPKQDLEDNWAVKAVLEVVKPFKSVSPKIHLEDRRLRRQIIRTLVHGGNADIASGILNKSWLLHVSFDQADAKDVLDIRRSIVQEVVQTVEEVNGLGDAATQFLRMVETWKNHLDGADGLPKGSINRSNPCFISAQYLLSRFAYQKNPESAELRRNLYQTCLPWVSNKLVKARLKLLYEDNPYVLYVIIMGIGEEVSNPALMTKACSELLLGLVDHQAWSMARNLILFMQKRLVGKVPGLEDQMIKELDALILDESLGLRDKFNKITKRLTEGRLVWLREPVLI